MKFNSIKYILILCLTIALFLKVGNMLSYLNFSAVDIENVGSNDDATEKEEKKVEAEYFATDFLISQDTFIPTNTSKKVIIPTCLEHLAYFPDVLTPPPSV